MINNALNLDLAEDGTVKITACDGINPELWENVVKFWGCEIVEGNKIYVPFDFFHKNRRWLKLNWIGLGYTAETSESLVNKVKGASNYQKEFLDLIAGKNLKIGEFDETLIDISSGRKLTPQQVNNVSRLLGMRNGANFSVPGAGKTMTTLIVWRYLQALGDVSKLVVICPKSAIGAWTEEPGVVFDNEIVSQELDQSMIKPETDVLITNFEKLESKEFLQRIKTWMQAEPSMLVIDEAHRIKGGASSVRWRGCSELSLVARRVDLLTGTPMPQSLNDLRNLMLISYSDLPESLLSENVLKDIAPNSIYVRTTKSELGLPEINFNFELIEQSPYQADIYSALKRAYAGTLSLNITDELFLGKKGRVVMSLIAAASNPGLLFGRHSEDAFLNLKWPPHELVSDDSLMSMLENYVKYETPAKYKWMVNWSHRLKVEGRKGLIWTSFVGNILALERLLEKFNPVVVYGAISDEDRKQRIKDFKEDENTHLLITNPQTLGEGISLHHVCHDSVYLDRTYNAGQYLQSIDRIHRLGLSADTITNVTVLGCRGTIDERVQSSLQRKINNMASMLDDPDLRPTGTLDGFSEDKDEFIGLSEADFNEVLKHLSE